MALPDAKHGNTGGRNSGNKSPSRRYGLAKLWLMRCILVVGIPALFIGILELGLRLAGTGYPTDFFETRTVEGDSFLFTNHQFTFRFFPRSLARSVLPYKIPTPKPDKTYRIFIFGESAANGDPDPAYGFGRHLEILLDERFPGMEFEVIVTAVTAVNSHVILPIARDCAKRDGDLWIIYMGNNEMIGPYGASTVFGSKAPPLALTRASIAAKTTRIGQLMQRFSEGLKKDSSNPESWGGIEMFTENLLHPNEPARLQVYENFKANLLDILETGEKAAVPILLSTVASNLRDCAPFASLHGKDLTARQLADWNTFYEKGKALEEKGAYEAALGQYRQAAEIDPGYAELAFRMGRCYGLSGDLKASRMELEKARDIDALAVRADSTINRIIRTAVPEFEEGAVALVDAAELVAAQSPGGIPGRETFYEHVHFTLQGNYQLARIFADRVRPLLPPEATSTDTGEWAGAGTCQRMLAATLWDKSRLWTEMEERQSRPPFASRLGNDYNLAHCQAKARDFRARAKPRFDRLVYELALKENPDDYLLHNRFGHYLELNGAIPEAVEQFRWITDTFPEFEGGHQELGLALLLEQRWEEAKQSFARVLEINPEYGKARTALKMIEEQRTVRQP